MLHRSIAFCEQTHGCCQGFACDDHISKECYTVPVTEAENAEITELVSKIEAIYQKELDAACDEWHCNNPDDEECLCEGEEFIGLAWVEDGGTHELGQPDNLDTALVTQKLRDLLAEKEATAS